MKSIMPIKRDARIKKSNSGLCSFTESPCFFYITFYVYCTESEKTDLLILNIRMQINKIERMVLFFVKVVFQIWKYKYVYFMWFRFLSYKIELQNRVTQNGITAGVTNWNIFV